MTELITAPLAFLLKDDLSTDEIIPSRFLLTTSVEGLGEGLLYDLRFGSNNKPIENFVLNKTDFQNGVVLVTGKNFGCGSSREHAAWALNDFGVKAIISESVATSFDRNAAHNKLPVLNISGEEIRRFAQLAVSAPSPLSVTIDLNDRIFFVATEDQATFSMSPLQEEYMNMATLDIDRALAQKDAIATKWAHLNRSVIGRAP